MVQYIDREIPSGTIDGINVTFTLTNAPSPAGSLMLFRNGVLQTAGVDFTLSGPTITFIEAPQAGDGLVAWYRAAGPAGSLSPGILRDDAVALIHRRLGNRSGLSEQIITELRRAQTRFERAAFLPWFLLTYKAEAVSENPWTLPPDFLREPYDEDAVWLVNSDNSYSKIPRVDYGLLRNNQDYAGMGTPKFYAMVGSRRVLFPAPDKSYSLVSLYYQSDAVLDTNITNLWLTYAPDLLISEAGFQMARYLRDFEIAGMFRQEMLEARQNLIYADVAYRESGLSHVIGG